MINDMYLIKYHVVKHCIISRDGSDVRFCTSADADADF